MSPDSYADPNPNGCLGCGVVQLEQRVEHLVRVRVRVRVRVKG